jgi:hypothetical protein
MGEINAFEFKKNIQNKVYELLQLSKGYEEIEWKNHRQYKNSLEIRSMLYKLMEMTHVVTTEYDITMKLSPTLLPREICENIRNIKEHGRELDDAQILEIRKMLNEAREALTEAASIDSGIELDD